MTPLVRLDHVRKSYGAEQPPALTDISLEVWRGDRIALIGRSGSGKSTVLNLMAALDNPSAGEVSWPALSTPLKPGQIGSAFQSPSLIPWLDVEENVRLAVVFSEVSRPSAPLEVLSRLGVGDLAKKLPGELSGGQAQRVALARAMATTPDLLLADEPSGQLDHETARQVIDTLTRWADESDVTLVIATHDPQVAATMTRVLALDHGRLVEIPE